MKTYLDCYCCFINQALKLARESKISEQTQKKLIDEVLKILLKIPADAPPPLIAEIITKLIYKYTKVKDPYKTAKHNSNIEALKLYPHLKKILASSKNKLFTGLKIAAFGNIIDYAIVENLNIVNELKNFEKLKVSFKKYNEFSQKIKKAKTLLIIGDNAGEIVFDKVLIEYLLKKYKNLKIYYSVRHKPALNDSTMADAKFTGLDKICSVISTGMAAPGIILPRCSDKFRKIFEATDLILNKKQKNFESLSSITKENLFYLLKI
ncbi:MAG TPA: ARMT1-like domain-containing protein, partial [bacterium]|nr:ARMT1-like domain-containing protein [bacterium]